MKSSRSLLQLTFIRCYLFSGTALITGNTKMNKTQFLHRRKRHSGCSLSQQLVGWQHSSNCPGHKPWNHSWLLSLTPVYNPSANCVDSISARSTSYIAIPTSTTLVQTIVISLLDYCNGLVTGLFSSNLLILVSLLDKSGSCKIEVRFAIPVLSSHYN